MCSWTPFEQSWHWLMSANAVLWKSLLVSSGSELRWISSPLHPSPRRQLNPRRLSLLTLSHCSNSNREPLSPAFGPAEVCYRTIWPAWTQWTKTISTKLRHTLQSRYHCGKTWSSAPVCCGYPPCRCAFSPIASAEAQWTQYPLTTTLFRWIRRL